MSTDELWLTLLTENLKERYMVEISSDDTFDAFLRRIEAMHPKDPLIDHIFLKGNPDQVDYELKIQPNEFVASSVIGWDQTETKITDLQLTNGTIITLTRKMESPQPNGQSKLTSQKHGSP